MEAIKDAENAAIAEAEAAVLDVAMEGLDFGDSDSETAEKGGSGRTSHEQEVWYEMLIISKIVYKNDLYNGSKRKYYSII